MSITQNASTEDALRLWNQISGDARGLLQLWTGIRAENGEFPRESIRTNFFDYPENAERAARWRWSGTERGAMSTFARTSSRDPGA
jgi:hypothetical protein